MREGGRGERERIYEVIILRAVCLCLDEAEQPVRSPEAEGYTPTEV